MANLRKSTVYGIPAVALFVLGFVLVIVRDIGLVQAGVVRPGVDKAWPPLVLGLACALMTGVAWAILIRRWERMSVHRARIAAVVALTWLAAWIVTFFGTHGLYRRRVTLWHGVVQVDTGWTMFLFAYQIPVIIMGLGLATVLTWLWVRDIIRTGY